MGALFHSKEFSDRLCYYEEAGASCPPQRRARMRGVRVGTLNGGNRAVR